MDLEDYRRRARVWLEANAPQARVEGTPDAGGVAAAKAFMAELYDAGYSGITWPAEWGGQGLTQAEERAFAAEAARFTLPTYVFSIGLGMCGPTLVDLGTDEQRRRYVRPLLRGEEIWCQLFSEPGAGSDVAALQTRAVPTDGGWVVDGQKVWTSVAQNADWGLLLTRTDVDVPKHKGLTMFIVDMHAPGVTVRPLRDMTGRAHFNEIFFDGVHIPAENLVGQVGGGWSCAVTTLLHERLSIAGGVGMSGQKDNPVAFEALRESADTGDPLVRDQLVELYVRSRALALFNQRLSQETKAGIFPGARGSAAKLLLAELTLFQADLASSLAGPEAVAHSGAEGDGGARLAHSLALAPAMALGGGTNEIMRNIVGERVLNLPPEPRTDKNVPFKDLKTSGGPAS
ncbi:acyl-CoA dehydrogenase family protein [Planomonospora venezuelensis]|uniref:Alkylation response protein AidB-like acyl-CoA dehydrogenase n=1 Tax=Planomonospora venezuelensis TaxID=1999 RepID=A0A841DEA9_PLAVE|nr:acyl-CoA dehydrogenase family protein [Planomonospora venezuelensis]MBB5966638.1 alkylation response protein AidB-like acyl-CoA dehydrogenase [Planomonospora venezuelensis]GIN03509.1 acyl-CoA dehydrogenase [Planomonospora venezuelensis]